MIEFIDKTAEKSGTKINRKNMMAIQGFVGTSVTYNSDGSITETNSEGQTRTIVFNTDGTITETFSGERTITKKTTISENGNVTEAIS